MKNIVEIRNLNFKYGDIEIFKDLNLTIQENTFTTILGPNGSGKTTLLNLLLGNIKSNGEIIINKLPVIQENLKHISRIMNIISEDKNLTANTVIEELNNSLKKASFMKNQFKRNIDEINKLLKLDTLLEKKPNTLNLNDKTLITIACGLITKPKLLVIDQTIDNLNEKEKQKIIKILQKKVKNKELTVVYMTNNSNDSLFSDNIIILGEKKVLVSGKKATIYKNEKNFENAGLELPFIIDLSKKLQFYNLTNKNYQSAEKMVKDLWK